MIFVTVGTHEQQFDRLIKLIDQMKADGEILEDVIIQSGYCTYEAQCCESHKFLSYDEMEKFVSDARIIVTHGGPSTFVMALKIGKTPIVVPRKSEFHEHVNDHQLDFAKAVENRQGTILVAESDEDIKNLILNYDEMITSRIKQMESNNIKFNESIEAIANSLCNK